MLVLLSGPVSSSLSAEYLGTGMVSLPSKIIPLSIGPFPNRFPVGPYPLLHGLSVSPTKVFLGYLGSFRLLLLPYSSKLPVGSWSCWTSQKWTGRLRLTHQNWSNIYPCLLAPTIAKIRHTRYSLWRQNLFHNSLSCQIPSVSSEELALPRLIRHNLLLSSYLCRIKRKENSSYSTCGHPLQDLTHLLDCPATEPLWYAIFGTTSSIFDLLSRPWGMARLLCLSEVPLCPHTSEGVR